ncbi:GMC family oxidoreductase [Achromobacter deleyi]|uniref:GMC family oxidoreductase n=1 Tax=Achromobacter deleyi TaxID=1353891 RepID=UPI001492283B|nr:GMC family oxidoreductase N-terminal domain-containing protein [Achromobacter deleyi]QVQ26869.1 GMC family oxidoreductase N-terminal domain-containing protein [Achromobacter deleyi]UIP22444.1 GMC family oxidoreductase N-terminal domain-containing protein [Achromobacter deleyi]
MGDYDFIIAGGGTAGCILANRLSADGKYRVLMLEAGQEARSMWISIPAGFSKLLVNPDYNWRFATEPEDNVYGRTIAVPRGKGVGGSTLINGMIYVRGQPQDYDGWEAAGAAGWGSREAERVFRKIENYAPGGEGRGKNGPMHLEEVAERFPVSDAFLQAAREDGQPFNPDYNSGSQEGVGYYQVLQHRGRRWSVVDGYMKPAAGRKNLSVECGAHVTRLVFEGKRCVGVAYRKNGQEHTVRARRETLLCMGAVQSPQLLELSGVGNPALLQSNGIALVHAQPQVGENYIDHYATRMNWRVKDTVTLNEMSRGWRLARQVARYYLRHKGILTLGTGLVHGFVKSVPDLPTPDVQFFFVHASYANAAERILDRHPGMTIGVAQLRPESVGSIHIKSADPLAGPSIRPNFLSAQVDRDSLVGGMQAARRIVGQPAMQRYVESEVSPGSAVDSYDEWLEFARRNGQTIYHPIGTCRMGSDAAAVTDVRLRVNGLSGLRVVDASVMPKMVSGNTQAAVMMVAERGAEMILEDAAQE